MKAKRTKANRKLIVLTRCGNKKLLTEEKVEQIHEFDQEMKLNMQSFIELEREKLRNLDKAAAKKVVIVAQNNLMSFLRSKAKVNCFRNQQNKSPFHISNTLRTFNKPNIFDNKLLQRQLSKEQKLKKGKQKDFSPLFERCLRDAAFRMQNRVSQGDLQLKEKASEPYKDSYCSLSSFYRRKRGIL